MSGGRSRPRSDGREELAQAALGLSLGAADRDEAALAPAEAVAPLVDGQLPRPGAPLADAALHGAVSAICRSTRRATSASAKAR